jgi:hypothetical protein
MGCVERVVISSNATGFLLEKTMLLGRYMIRSCVARRVCNRLFSLCRPVDTGNENLTYESFKTTILLHTREKHEDEYPKELP